MPLKSAFAAWHDDVVSESGILQDLNSHRCDSMFCNKRAGRPQELGKYVSTENFFNTSRFHIEAFLQPRQNITVGLLGTSERHVSRWLDTPTTAAKFVRTRTN